MFNSIKEIVGEFHKISDVNTQKYVPINERTIGIISMFLQQGSKSWNHHGILPCRRFFLFLKCHIPNFITGTSVHILGRIQ